MTTIHLTNGDYAADSLRVALHAAGRDDPVHALRDDLAVGPLRGVDDVPHMRARFWEQVMEGDPRDFPREFDEQAAALADIAAAGMQVVVWHGESASDQLMLRRVCYHLRNTPQRLNEVRLSVRDLADPDTSGLRREDGATSVGMFSPAILQERLADAAPISVLRISRLALEWQEVKQANGETRRWRDNTCTSGAFADLDAQILEQADDAWQPASRIGAQLMSSELGFLVSDSIVLWRLRELASSARVCLRGDASGWRALELRAALSTCSS